MPLSPMRNRQSGAYLLEALVGMLIFSLGILGIVGLQAASLRTTSDAGLRAEAVFAANQYIGQMWTDDESKLDSYSSAVGGQPYQDFAAQLKAAQAGAWYQDPTVVVSAPGAGPTPTSRVVQIRITWKMCSDPNNASCNTQDVDVHNYATSAVIGQNQW